MNATRPHKASHEMEVLLYFAMRAQARGCVLIRDHWLCKNGLAVIVTRHALDLQRSIKLEYDGNAAANNRLKILSMSRNALHLRYHACFDRQQSTSLYVSHHMQNVGMGGLIVITYLLSSYSSTALQGPLSDFFSCSRPSSLPATRFTQSSCLGSNILIFKGASKCLAKLYTFNAWCLSFITDNADANILCAICKLITVIPSWKDYMRDSSSIMN